MHARTVRGNRDRASLEKYKQRCESPLVR
jgi:hypothetical protein